MQNLIHRFIAYKYTILFSAMIMLIGVMPFLEQQQGLLVPILMPIFMLIMILGVLDTLDLPKTLFRTCVVLGIMAFVFHLVGKILGGAAQAQEEVAILLIIGLGSYAVFLFISIGAMIGKIFTQTQVTVDTIRGGIAVYFLLGIFWACLYRLLLHFDPQAIAISNYDGEFSTILYFSFATLTTLGYGDIVPIAWQARSLTILESTIGQIYMTVLIARLVGLHLTGMEK